jgi:hypothetical protein
MRTRGPRGAAWRDASGPLARLPRHLAQQQQRSDGMRASQLLFALAADARHCCSRRCRRSRLSAPEHKM